MHRYQEFFFALVHVFKHTDTHRAFTIYKHKHAHQSTGTGTQVTIILYVVSSIPYPGTQYGRYNIP